MAEGRGFELVGRWAGVISRRETAELRGAGEANGGPMDPVFLGGPLLGHRAACDGLTQPFEQAFKTRQALADLRLALLHGSDAEKPAELDGHQHVVRDFPRPEAEIEEQRRQAAQYEDRDATTDRVREPVVISTADRADSDY